MKYPDATRGTLLKALVMSFTTMTRMETMLKQMDEQADEGWDKLAGRLQRDMVEAVHDARLRAGGKDVPKRTTIDSMAQDALKDERHWSVVDVADRAENAAGLARAILEVFCVKEIACQDGCEDCRKHAKNVDG